MIVGNQRLKPAIIKSEEDRFIGTLLWFEMEWKSKDIMDHAGKKR